MTAWRVINCLQVINMLTFAGAVAIMTNTSLESYSHGIIEEGALAKQEWKEIYNPAASYDSAASLSAYRTIEPVEPVSNANNHISQSVIATRGLDLGNHRNFNYINFMGQGVVFYTY